MTCPHCNYKYGWNPDTGEYVKGEKYDFYELPMDMIRANTGGVSLYACPNCGKAFINV